MDYNFPMSPVTASYIQNRQLPQAQNNNVQQPQAAALSTPVPEQKSKNNTTRNIAIGVTATIAAVTGLALLAKNGKLGDSSKKFIDGIINKFKPNKAVDVKNAMGEKPAEVVAETIKEEIAPAVQKTVDNTEEIIEQASKNLKDIAFRATEGGKKDGLARLKDGSLFTGTIEDTLKNGKPIILEYKDGEIFQSIIGNTENKTAIRKTYTKMSGWININTQKQSSDDICGMPSFEESISSFKKLINKDFTGATYNKGPRSIQTAFVPNEKLGDNAVNVFQLNTDGDGISDTLKLFSLKDNKVLKIKDEKAMMGKISDYINWQELGSAKTQENSLLNRLTGKAPDVIGADGTALIKANIVDGKVVISDVNPKNKMLAKTLECPETDYTSA